MDIVENTKSTNKIKRLEGPSSDMPPILTEYPDFYFGIPYTFDTCEKIYFNRGLNNLWIEELSFRHLYCSHNVDDVHFVWDILLRHSVSLSKLRATSCMFLGLWPITRTATNIHVENIDNLLNAFQRITELQLFCCPSLLSNGQVFDVICCFNKLEKLTIKLQGEGLDFYRVTLNCLHLKSIRLEAQTISPNINRNIVRALRNGALLEEIILDCNTLNPHFILKHVNEIRFVNLKVFVIKTNLMQNICIYDQLQTFFNRNVNLVHFYVECRMTVREKIRLRNLCSQYSKDHRERIFRIVRKNVYSLVNKDVEDIYQNLREVDSDWSTLNFRKFK